MSKLYYLASPYSHKYMAVRSERYEQAQEMAVRLMTHGLFVFSPIAYNHPWTKYELPMDFYFWEAFDKSFIDKTDGLIVYEIEGWKESRGVFMEAEYARYLRKPVYFLPFDEQNLDDWISSVGIEL